MPIQWRKEMSIDGGLLDDDHKYLFKLINEFEQIMDTFESEKILEALKKLQYYTVTHFAKEESFMRSVETSKEAYNEHVGKHIKLKEIVNNAITVFEKEITIDKQARIKDNILGLLQAWIVGHILKYDLPIKSDYQNYKYKHKPKITFGI